MSAIGQSAALQITSANNRLLEKCHGYTRASGDVANSTNAQTFGIGATQANFG